MADSYSVKLDIQFETIKGLKDALALANKELEKAKVNTVEWANAFENLSQLKAQMTQVNQVIRQTAITTQGSTTASSNAAMALLNLNYVVRDSPYFFNNFALGILAVGNNLNPLIDSFNRLRKEGVEKNISTFALLKQAMVGGAGISIAFSVIVTAIQSYVFATSKANSNSKNLTDAMKDLWSETYKTAKAWDEFVLSLDKMSKTDIEESLRGINKELKEGKPVFQEWISLVLNLGNGMDILAQRMAEMVKQKGELEKSLETKKEGTVGSGIIEEQEALVQSYEILVKSAKTDEERLGWLKLYKEAQEKLNLLLGKSKKIHEEITGQIHKQAMAMQVLMNVASQAEFIGGDIRNLRGGGVQPADNKPSPSLFEGATGKKMKDSMKEFQVQLELAKIAAQELGQFLADAFMKGKFALDEFIKSLAAAIIQMLTIQTIMAFLNPVGAIAGMATGSGGLRKSNFTGGLGKSAIRVTGKITADKNNFIANIRNADNYYSRNEEFLVIGR